MIRSIVRPSTNEDIDPRCIADGEQAAFEGSSDLPLASLFHGAFRGRIDDGEAFRCWAYHSERDARVVLELADPERERVVWFEAGVNRRPDPSGAAPSPQPAAAAAVLSEFLHDVLERYLGEDRWPAPHPDFVAHEHEGLTVYLRGRAFNERLERMADAWLAEGGRQHNPGPADDEHGH